MRFRVVVLALVLGVPTSSRAQIPGLDQVFGKVQAVNTTIGRNWLFSSRDLRRSTLLAESFEISLYAASWGCLALTKSMPMIDSAGRKVPAAAVLDSLGFCHAERVQDSVDDKMRQWCEARSDLGTATDQDPRCVDFDIDSTWTERDFRSSDSKGTRRDKYGIAQHERTLTTERYRAEIGLSYGLLNGFTQTANGLAISGTVQELPVVALYLEAAVTDGFVVYVGPHGGVSTFSSLHVFTAVPDSAYTGSAGTAFSYGLAAGFAKRIISDHFYLLVEGDATDRVFRDVTWGTSKSPPTALPGRLDVSSYGVNIGVQLEL